MPYVARRYADWTPELDAKLRGLFEYGLRSRAVAEQMGMSVGAVESRYYRLKKEQAGG